MSLFQGSGIEGVHCSVCMCVATHVVQLILVKISNRGRERERDQ